MKLTLFVVFLISLALHDAQGSCWRRTPGGPPPPAGSPTQPKGRPTAPPTNPSTCQKVPLHRYWNARWVDHFYTINFKSLGKPGKHGFRYEWIQAYVYQNRCKGSVPLYRYLSSRWHDHFYTINPNDIGTTVPGKKGKHGYISEGHEGYCMPYRAPGTVPLYRYWKASGGDHFYTTNIHAIGTATPGRVGKYGYKSEGITCYVFPRP